MNTKLLAILVCALWGSAFAGGKIGLAYSTPLHLAGLRFMLAGLLLVPLLVQQKVDWKASLKEWKYMLGFGVVQTFLQYGLFTMGLNDVPAAVSAIIVGAVPLFVAIMAHFIMSDDKLNFRKSFAILLGIVGITFISVAKGGAIHISSTFYIGVLLLVLSNVCGASTNIIVAKNKGRVSPIMLTAFANLSGGIMLYVVSLFTEECQLQSYTPEFYLALLWLALISSLGFALWYILLLRPGVKVSELNIWRFVIPVSGAILSWILLPNETPDLYSIIGILVIVVALITLQWTPQANKNISK